MLISFLECEILSYNTFFEFSVICLNQNVEDVKVAPASVPELTPSNDGKTLY